MIIELNNIIIESKVKLSYLADIVKYIRDNEKRILDFFNIDKISQKYKIIIMPFNEFRNYIINNYSKEEIDKLISNSNYLRKKVMKFLII